MHHVTVTYECCPSKDRRCCDGQCRCDEGGRCEGKCPSLLIRGGVVPFRCQAYDRALCIDRERNRPIALPVCLEAERNQGRE